jgi:hypothetical protein
MELLPFRIIKSDYTSKEMLPRAVFTEFFTT